MDELVTMRSNDPDYPMKEYAVEIVRGITEKKAEIDEIISTYSQGWTLDRMPAVDRSLLEIGTWELLFNDEVPDKVAIDEAVSLARQFSTDDSPELRLGPALTHPRRQTDAHLTPAGPDSGPACDQRLSSAGSTIESNHSFNHRPERRRRGTMTQRTVLDAADVSTGGHSDRP
jgi:N utilization substance protein B